MRADRLLSLVLLLRHRGRMSAAALARELECSTRTVLRDVEALSAAGVPVYAERGRAGGFALLPGWSTDLTGLTLDEARALLVAGARPGVGPELAAAMRKVVAALPQAQREVATTAAERVLVSPERMLGTADPEDVSARARLLAVQRAVFARRRLRLRYAARGEEPRWRTVDPVGLVEAAGRWYLLATRDGEERTYRLSRVREVAELDEPAAGRPVDLRHAWAERRDRFRASLPRVRVRLRILPERRAALAAVARDVDAHGTDAGWDVLSCDFGDLRHAAGVLWQLSPDVEALDPPELRAMLAERAAGTVARHTDMITGSET
ncbi:helix-turn-helix transcriptional regulator [Pseudonocardia sp.]|uniref:helix-turn-helix transcriptional regulator n=1 Tax=Pseudonocardia sp. TaxID=60912 RepID=UPI003D0F3BE5